VPDEGNPAAGCLAVLIIGVVFWSVVVAVLIRVL